MLALFASAPSYVNNFPAHDNPYNISLPADRDASFAFLLADFGTDTIAPGHTPCCQLDVANAMRAKRAELEAQGKSLLFVAAGGCIVQLVVGRHHAPSELAGKPWGRR